MPAARTGLASRRSAHHAPALSSGNLQPFIYECSMQAKPDADKASSAPTPETITGPKLETRRSDPASAAGAVRANVRLSDRVRQLFGLLLALLFLLASYAYWIYQTEIKPTLEHVRDGRPAAAPAPVPAAPVARAIEIQLPPETRRQLDESKTQIEALQEQLAKAAAELTAQKQQLSTTLAAQTAQTERLQALDLRLEEVKAAAPARPLKMTETPLAPAATESSEADTTLGASSDSPAMAELRLMKERNRLSAYADEAISSGERRSLDLLIEAMKDPERASLYHAARAEYYRIMGHYQLINRIDPAYKLPITKLFPEEKIRDEADLTTEQIIALLKNRDIEWQSRLRSAYLLGGRRTPEVAAALLQALKEDPNLDVAKEAQLSLEQNVGRNFLLFDIAGVDNWWREQMKSGQAKETPAPSGN